MKEGKENRKNRPLGSRKDDFREGQKSWGRVPWARLRGIKKLKFKKMKMVFSREREEKTIKSK